MCHGSVSVYIHGTERFLWDGMADAILLLPPARANKHQTEGRTLENNDSILMVFVDESVHFRVRLRERVD